MIALESLRKSDLLEGLCDDELVAIARIARLETYPAGVCVLQEGEPARDLYIVNEGRVAILINIGRHRQTVIDNVCVNGSFGWAAMVPPYTLTETVKTLEPCRVLIVPGAELRHVCRQSCATCYTIMEKVATMVSARLRATRLQLVSLIST
jgi:CRP/FNR family transcriptional regulator, cyclic AMP receptor protein